MSRLLAAVALGGVAIAQFSFAGAKPEQAAVQLPAATAESAPEASGALHELPPPPQGKTTILGGEIQNVDPVRDEITLKIAGGGAMKVLFDARTRIYRDGRRIPARGLRSDEHASVETVLDGTSVFALSVHMLSQSPEGEYEGQLLNYDPGTGELIVAGALSSEPIKLFVPAGTPVVRPGQARVSSTRSGLSGLVTGLVKGALLSIKFGPGTRGQNVVSRIVILATPGSAFVFRGNISVLDMRSGVLVLVDPSDNKNYRISFDPGRFPMSRNLHEGEHVTVRADFDGAGYVASAITIG